MVYFGLKFIFRKYHHNTLITKIKKLVIGVKAGITSIRYLQNKRAFIFHSIFIWCCYLGGTYLGFYATIGTENLPVAAAFPVLAFASIGMIITPGGIGSYPRLVTQVMLLYNVEEGIAFANGNLQWIAQTAIILLVGFISVLLLPYINKPKAVEES
jgi:glycosyltransferase 2 family protein